MATISVAATIALAWIADHPAKVTGSIITLIAFGIITVIVRFRGDSTEHTTKWKRTRRTTAKRR